MRALLKFAENFSTLSFCQLSIQIVLCNVWMKFHKLLIVEFSPFLHFRLSLVEMLLLFIITLEEVGLFLRI